MKLLLVSHGNFCHGIKESYEMIAGKNDNIIAINLGEDGIGNFSEKLNKKLDELTKTDKVLVLTDIQGGTPYNETLRYQLANPGKIEIVSGMNLPMVIESGMSLATEDCVTALARNAEQTGKDAIIYSEVSLEEDEDDDLDF